MRTDLFSVTGASLLLFAFVAPSFGVIVTPPPPEVRLYGDIPYLTGGVGEVERATIQAMGEHYPLKLIFSTKNGGYLSDVAVMIEDMSRRTMVAAVSDGPWLFADLPAGQYRVSVTALGQSFEALVRLDSGRQTRVNFSSWAPRQPVSRASR
jgi:hypothetical protein